MDIIVQRPRQHYVQQDTTVHFVQHMRYDVRPDTIVQKVILHQNLVLKGTIVRLTPVHINHVRPVLIVQLDLKHQQLVQQDTTVRLTPLMLYNAQRGTIVRKMD